MQKVLLIGVLVLFLLSVTTDLALADPVDPLSGQATIPPASTLNLALVGHLGGESHAVAVNGAYIYAGFGPEFAALDPVDSLQRVGYTLLPDVVQQIVLTEDYAYVAAGGILHLIDISQPEQPTPVAVYQGPANASITDVVMADNRAYLTVTTSSGACILHTVEITDPTHPVKLGEGSIDCEPIAVQGNYLYQALVGRGFRVLNVSDPASPTVVATLPSEPIDYGHYSAQDIVVRDGYAYVLNAIPLWSTQGELRILSISDPTNPTVVGAVDLDGYAVNLVLLGNLAYVVGGLNTGVHFHTVTEFYVVDIANPASPTLLSKLDVPGIGVSVAISGDRAYVSARPLFAENGGVHVLDVTNPANPALIDAYVVPDEALHLAVQESFAYVVEEFDILWVIDIDTPTNPRPVGKMRIAEEEEWIKELVVEGDLLYAASQGALLVISIADPVHPMKVAQIPIAFNAFTVTDTYVYFATCSGILVFDFSDPSQPLFKERFETIGCSTTITANDRYAYVYDATGFLWVLDIAEPDAPVQAGFETLFVPSSVSDLQIDEGRLYIIAPPTLYILDLADPVRPVRVGQIEGISEPVLANSGYVYSYAANGLDLIDATDPAAPALAGFYHIGPYPAPSLQDLAFADGLVYAAFGYPPTDVAEGEGQGLVILKRAQTPIMSWVYLPTIYRETEVAPQKEISK